MPVLQRAAAGVQWTHDALADIDARVVALSVKDEETTRKLGAKPSLAFPIAYGADAAAIAAATGAFVHEDPTYLQSTGFVFGPSGRVLVSVYSSGTIGRLVPDFIRRHAPLPASQSHPQG